MLSFVWLGARRPVGMVSRERLSAKQPGLFEGLMSKDTYRDTVDCLLSELTDAYEELDALRVASEDWTADVIERWVYTKNALASIERAYQLVSDLKAAQS